MSLFFSDTKTQEAIQEISTAENLVLYCGAGVTIDRTGLSWNRLLELMVEYSEQNDSRKGRKGIFSALKQLIASNIPEEQKASALLQFITEEQGLERTTFLRNSLSAALYDSQFHAFSMGRILQNTALLAISAARRCNNVTILTTNYDVYLESKIQYLLTALKASNKTASIPGLENYSFSSEKDEWQSNIISPPANCENLIRIYYLHGRINETEKTIALEGEVLLDECSYSSLRHVVSQKIREEIESASLFVVGASLNDSPLIDALASAKQSEKKVPRIAIVRKNPSHVVQDSSTTADDVRLVSQLRSAHLGLDILHADDFSQIAQFIEETKLAFISQKSNDVPYSTVGFYRRLRSWKKKWEKSKLSPVEMNAVMEEVRAETKKLVPGMTDNSSLKVETWIRDDHPDNSRYLSLVASSEMILSESRVGKTIRVYPDSEFSAVKSFMTGKIHMETTENSARWIEFFSLPIYVSFPVKSSGHRVYSSIPVGVITLSAFKGTSFLDAIDRLNHEHIKQLLHVITSAGEKVLNPYDDK